MLRQLIPLAALLGACSTAPDAGPDGPIAVAPRAVWGDGELTLRSAALAGTVAVRMQGDTASLPQRRIDDSTIAVRLPLGTRGSAQLTVDDGSRTLLAERVTVYGFIRQFDFDANPDRLVDLAILPGRVLAGDEGGALTMEPATGTLRRFPGTGDFSFALLQAPGPTYEDGVFASEPPGWGDLQRWRLFPLPQQEGGAPLARFRLVMQLNPDAWLTASDDDYRLQVRADEASPFQTTMFGQALMFGFLMSPRHDRGVMLMASRSEDPPVLDAPSATVAWRMPVRAVFGADFDASGESLAVVGADTWDVTTSRLLVLRAAEGSLVRDTTFERRALAVHFDPVLPLIYVLFARPDTVRAYPDLLVLQRDTFRPVAEMSAPSTAGDCVSYADCSHSAITRGPEPIVSVISGWRAYTFDVPPGADTFSVARAAP